MKIKHEKRRTGILKRLKRESKEFRNVLLDFDYFHDEAQIIDWKIFEQRCGDKRKRTENEIKLMIKACKRGEKRNQDLKNRILDEKRFVPQFMMSASMWFLQ